MCFFLSLQRESAQRRGPLLLVVAPSEDLMMQIGGVARTLAGRNANKLVFILRRDITTVDGII